MSEELKPSAWIVIECGCRAPDDCEDYEVLVSVEDIGNYQSHIDHGRAYPLYEHPLSITKADVDEHCKANGLVMVPEDMLEIESDIGSLQGWLYGRSSALNGDTDNKATSMNEQLHKLRKQRRKMIAAYKVQAL